MATQPRPYQKLLIDSIKAKFEDGNRIIFNGMCGIGKTFITLHIIRDLINSGKRVLVYSASHNNIKAQWLNEILKHELLDEGQFKILCSKEIYNDSKNTRHMTTSVGDSAPLIIAIPQTTKAGFGDVKFDYIFIDEAHDYVDIKSGGMGLIKKTISINSHDKTIVVGLTATAFELISDIGGFFFGIPDSSCIIFDIKDALNNGVIANTCIHVIKFEFVIPDRMYNDSDELTNKGEELVKSKIYSARKVEDVLGGISGKTIVVSLPLQDIELYDFINMKFGSGCCVLNSEKNNNSKDAETEFRNNPNVKFMVVIKKCGIGWDYAELENVVDLTFTRSHKLQIQRMLRPSRVSALIANKVGNYIYCCDQTRSDDEIMTNVGKSISLMRRDNILAYRHEIVFENCPIIKKSFSQGSIPGTSMKVAVADWIVDYDILFKKRTLDIIPLFGSDAAVIEIFKIMTWIDFDDLKKFHKSKDLEELINDAIKDGITNMTDFRCGLRSFFGTINDMEERDRRKGKTSFSIMSPELRIFQTAFIKYEQNHHQINGDVEEAIYGQSQP